MIIIKLSQLDDYILKIGDIIQFTSDMMYSIEGNEKQNCVKNIGTNDIYTYLGTEIKDCSSHLSYYDRPPGASIDNQGLGGSIVNGFPCHSSIKTTMDMRGLTQTTKTAFKMLFLKHSKPNLLLELTASLSYKEKDCVIQFIARINEEYKLLDLGTTEVLTINQISNEKVIVPKKNPTITRGKVPTGCAVQGKVRRVTIVSQYLSFTAGCGY